MLQPGELSPLVQGERVLDVGGRVPLLFIPPVACKSATRCWRSLSPSTRQGGVRIISHLLWPVIFAVLQIRSAFGGRTGLGTRFIAAPAECPASRNLAARSEREESLQMRGGLYAN